MTMRDTYRDHAESHAESKNPARVGHKPNDRDFLVSPAKRNKDFMVLTNNTYDFLFIYDYLIKQPNMAISPISYYPVQHTSYMYISIRYTRSKYWNK